MRRSKPWRRVLFFGVLGSSALLWVGYRNWPVIAYGELEGPFFEDVLDAGDTQLSRQRVVYQKRIGLFPGPDYLTRPQQCLPCTEDRHDACKGAYTLTDAQRPPAMRVLLLLQCECERCR